MFYFVFECFRTDVRSHYEWNVFNTVVEFLSKFDVKVAVVMSRKSSAPAWYISVVLLILIHRLSKRSFKNYSRCEVNMFFSQQYDSSIYYRIRDILLSLNRKSDKLLSLYRCVRCQHDWMSLLTQNRIIFELVSHWTVLSGFSFGWISRWFLSFHYYWTDNGQMLGQME